MKDFIGKVKEIIELWENGIIIEREVINSVISALYDYMADSRTNPFWGTRGEI